MKVRDDGRLRIGPLNHISVGDSSRAVSTRSADREPRIDLPPQSDPSSTASALPLCADRAVARGIVRRSPHKHALIDNQKLPLSQGGRRRRPFEHAVIPAMKIPALRYAQRQALNSWRELSCVSIRRWNPSSPPPANAHCLSKSAD